MWKYSTDSGGKYIILGIIIKHYDTGVCIYSIILFIITLECTLSTYQKPVFCETVCCVILAATLEV